MDYFKILNLSKEPFSNSPDPEFFFQSRCHLDCLQKIELSIRLRRGLNVVIGDVGTGKTTLCRQLIRKFASDEKMETHLILDPYFSSPSEFLSTVAEMFVGYRQENGNSDWQVKEIIKKYLFRRGVGEKKTVILIIDEGQKLPLFCLEILREFLNYETNEYKLLQIIIFGQREFEQTTREHHNLADRISLYQYLEPLNFRETRSMIQFRLDQASDSYKAPVLFSYPALWAIYRATGGYPRKIINVCHRIILTMIIQNRSRAGWFLVRSCVRRVLPVPSRKWRWVTTAALTGLVVVALIGSLAPGRLEILMPWAGQDLMLEAVSQTSHESVDEAAPETGTETPVNPVSAAMPETSPEVPIREYDFPRFLGQLTVNPRETLGETIHAIYGVFNRQYLKRVMEVNQQIKNPDLIEPGQVIHFPAISVRSNPLTSRFWWVEVATKNRLEDAHRFLRTYSSVATPMRIIPCWNSHNGLKFIILLNHCFDNEQSARNSLMELLPAVASDAKTFTEWDGDTILFANPV